MKQRFLIWSVAGVIFLATLGVSSWRSGLWQPDPAADTNTTAAQRRLLASQIQTPPHPFATALGAKTVGPPAARPTAPEGPLVGASPPLDPPLDASPPPPAELPAPPEHVPEPMGAPPPELTESLLESGPGVDNGDVLAQRDDAARRDRDSH